MNISVCIIASVRTCLVHQRSLIFISFPCVGREDAQTVIEKPVKPLQPKEAKDLHPFLAYLFNDRVIVPHFVFLVNSRT